MHGVMSDVGTLSYAQSGAFGINDYGQVVGTYVTSGGSPQAFLYAVYLLWEAVAGDDDLFMHLMEGVEGVEELFLGSLLTTPKLYIVYKKQVYTSELLPEFIHLMAAYVVYELVHKPLG